MFIENPGVSVGVSQQDPGIDKFGFFKKEIISLVTFINVLRTVSAHIYWIFQIQCCKRVTNRRLLITLHHTYKVKNTIRLL